ncbi:tetratricopeptide repeat protein [Actinacidiphila yeochonensis]|uniref:tetratricopeptide repeat protein n=1 Tax=Actinacidiphila yeochonensis TaxID=89050 RepID=UPI000A6CFF57|nr:tetratricopeptide repeat protein [Actinacidiphila yeochonensis]
MPAHFAGRTRERAELRAEIRRPGLSAVRGGRAAARVRVLLVAGRPGTGRTALAVRLAHDVAGDYPDGRFFVRLTDDAGRPVPPARTAAALLRALGVLDAGADPAGRWRAEAARRRLLLVLDDVPHADQLDGLLPDAPGCLVVATAAGPLSGVPDVRPCVIGGLDAAAALEVLVGRIGDTRVTNDPRAAEALVHELSCHPAALRMAAAWLAARPRTSLADAVARLRAASDTPFTRRTAAEEPGSVLEPIPETSPEPTAESRRPAAPGVLVRAFRTVHADLPAPSARLLRALVLAPAGSIDAHIASALAGCPPETAARALDALEDAALLAPGSGAGLYRLPECLVPMLDALLYTSERPQDIRLARARMLERTVRLLEAARPALTGAPADTAPAGGIRFASAAAAGQWLRARRPALVAAARTAVDDGELDTLARRLVAALVLALRADPGADPGAVDRYLLHTLALTVAERRGLVREKAAALVHLADLDAEAGRTEQAAAGYRKALDAARAADDTEAEGRVLEALGGAHLERGDLPRACDWFGRALALRQARGELLDQARLHARTGAVLVRLGRYPEALRAWRAAGPRTGGSATSPPRCGRSRRPPGCRSTPARARTPCARAATPCNGPARGATTRWRPRCCCAWPTSSPGSATPAAPTSSAPPPAGCWAPASARPSDRPPL